MRFLFVIMMIAALAYLSVLSFIYIKQRDLLYFPDSQHIKPADVQLEQFTEITLETPDGEMVVGWYVKAEGNKPTLLRFHGNASSVDYEAKILSHYLDHGYGLFILSYRGYGASTGTPSEEGLITDAITAYDYLIAAGIPSSKIVATGHSLGAGIVVQLASRKPVAAAILVSPFTAAVDIGANAYPYLPVRLLMKDQYRSIERVGLIRAPILIIHGNRDQTIPHTHGEVLFEAANEPKELVILNGAGHANLMDYGSEEAALEFLARLFPDTP